MNEKPIAFDLSLNSTGVWLPSEDGLVVRGLGPSYSDQHRHTYLFNTFCELLAEHQPTVVYKEAIFVHRQRMNGSVQLIQVHGLLTAACAVMDVIPPIYEVSPTALKAWATETGLGSKDGKADKQVMDSAARAMGYTGKAQSDIVDAYLVRRYFDACGV